MTAEALKDQVVKLSPKDGDIIVIQGGLEGMNEGDVSAFVHGLYEADIRNYVVILPAGSSMRCLDEKGMREAGWVRAPSTHPGAAAIDAD